VPLVVPGVGIGDEDHGATEGTHLGEGRAPARISTRSAAATRARRRRRRRPLPSGAALRAPARRGRRAPRPRRAGRTGGDLQLRMVTEQAGSAVAERPIDPPRPLRAAHAKRRRDVAEGGCPVAELLPDRVAGHLHPRPRSNRAVPGRRRRRRRRGRRGGGWPVRGSAFCSRRRTGTARAGRRAPPAPRRTPRPPPRHRARNRRMMRRASLTDRVRRTAKPATVAGWAKSRPRISRVSRGMPVRSTSASATPPRRPTRSTAPSGSAARNSSATAELGSGAPPSRPGDQRSHD